MDARVAFFDSATRRNVPPGISALAEDIACGHVGTVAVLAYGSALRESTPEETLIDFHLLVERAEHVSTNAALRFIGNLVPPNVHYAERNIAGRTLRCKYAVMTVQRFIDLNGADASNPYLWARFAQPSRIAWTADDDVRATVVGALAVAARTALGHGLFLSPTAPWQVLFENTYRTELRPENTSRAALIVDADRDYFTEVSRLLADVTPQPSSWVAKRVFGKLWSIARLAKAAFTFQGGADYAAWKIARHSGVKIEVTDWQRRHPLLAGLVMLPKLLRSRGLK